MEKEQRTTKQSTDAVLQVTSMWLLSCMFNKQVKSVLSFCCRNNNA